MRMFDRVQAEAANAEPLKLLLTVIAIPFVVLGWLVGTCIRVIVFLLGWAAAAAKVGFADGRGRGSRR
jgi:hypothetical protein